MSRGRYIRHVPLQLLISLLCRYHYDEIIIIITRNINPFASYRDIKNMPLSAKFVSLNASKNMYQKVHRNLFTFG